MEPFDKEKRQESFMGNDTKRILILFNDDVNSFDHVIDVLCEACDFDFEQAEQCALIVHHKGKYAIKSGSLDDLIAAKNTLESKNLSVIIE